MTESNERCETYWGTHGCKLEWGHALDVHCICECCECVEHKEDGECVGAIPWYGNGTLFYGEDAWMEFHRIQLMNRAIAFQNKYMNKN